MKCFYKMLFRYLFANKLMTKLRTNLCDRCLLRLVSTKTGDNSSVKFQSPKKRTKANDYYLCIEDNNLAKIVAKYVTSDLPDDSIIFESCPGSGVLTKLLLKSSAKSVRVFEDNPNYLMSLKNLQEQYPDRLQIIDKQILNFRKFLSDHLNEFEFEVEFWFKNIAVKEWRSVPSVRFVAVLSPKNSLFLRFILKIVARRDLFFSYGRTEFFAFVCEKEYQYMTAQPQTNYSIYRSTTVLYNTFFDIQILETVPYNSFEFYTKSNENISKNKLKKQSAGNARLVRLTPKPNLDELNEQTLQDFYFFVNQTFMKRKNYVIPFLENWFPNCGPDLIDKGIPIFKYFGDLRPEEVLDIFKYFYNRSDYQNSLYKMLSSREYDETIKEDVEDNEDDTDLKDKNE